MSEINSSNIKPLTRKGMMTRQKLLDTAEEIFSTKGYFYASIVDITQKAEVAQGTFYNYFSSKQEIFEELIKQLSSNSEAEILKEVDVAKAAKAVSAKEVLMIGLIQSKKVYKKARKPLVYKVLWAFLFLPMVTESTFIQSRRSRRWMNCSGGSWTSISRGPKWST